MTDLVKRLRAGEPCQPHDDVCRSIEARSGCICAEAADEIERLRHPKIIVGSRKLWEAMGLVVARSDALEEAAKVAEDFYPNQTYGISIAFAIRSLKEKS